jgi:hypothetical protein
MSLRSGEGTVCSLLLLSILHCDLNKLAYSMVIQAIHSIAVSSGSNGTSKRKKQWSTAEPCNLYCSSTMNTTSEGKLVICMITLLCAFKSGD